VFVPGKSPAKMQFKILDIFFLEEFHIVHMDGKGGGVHVSLRVVNVTWIDLDSFAFIFHFMNQFCKYVGV
jgi:hypothetical protein